MRGSRSGLHLTRPPRRVYHARPGVSAYGSPLGILLLADYGCPLIPGDPGNASTFDFPVCHAVVPGLTVDTILGSDGDRMTDSVVATAKRLVQEGAAAITGNCGFMLRYQDSVSRALPGVPVFLSSLIQLPLLTRSVGAPERVCLLTADAEALAGVLPLAGPEAERVQVKGLRHCPEFRSAVLEESGTIDFDAVETEVVSEAIEAAETNPEIAAFLLECAGLPPFAAAVQAATERPVFDCITLIEMFVGAVRRQPIAGVL